jgi:hypothetical protein
MCPGAPDFPSYQEPASIYKPEACSTPAAPDRLRTFQFACETVTGTFDEHGLPLMMTAIDDKDNPCQR